MNSSKAWYTSKSVIGGLVAVLAGAAGLLGYQVAEADQAQIVDAVIAVSSVVGGLIAVYGRVTATKAIK